MNLFVEFLLHIVFAEDIAPEADKARHHGHSFIPTQI
jgi:hypothetical protein